MYKKLGYLLLVCFVFILRYSIAASKEKTMLVRQRAPIDTVVVDSIALDSIVVDSTNASTTSNAITEPVDYNSKDSIRFVIADRKVFIYGESKVLYQDIDLQAEVIELDMEKREVFAFGVQDSIKGTYGEPHFIQGTEEFDAEKLRYNFESQRGLVYGIITEQSDGYLHSKVTKIQENKEVHVRGGKYTTCDLDHPHFYVNMTKAKLIPEKQIVTGPAYLVIEDVPIPLAIPFGFFPNQKGRHSGILMPTIGEENDKGFFLKNGGAYIGFSDHIDLAVRGDIYSMGSWRVNGNSNYARRYKFNGNLTVEYASLVIDETPQNKTYRVLWNHRQDPKAHPTRQFNANVNYMSAAHSKQNAQTENQYLNNQIASSIFYANRTSNNMLNYNASFNHDQNLLDSTISLMLPTLRMSMTNIYPFKRKKKVGKENFIDRLSIGYSSEAQHALKNAKMDSAFYTQETLDEFQKAIKHSVPIGTSMKLLKYMTLSPNFQYTERWYFEKDRTWHNYDAKILDANKDTIYNVGEVQTEQVAGFYRVYDYSTSASLSTKMYGMYNYRSDLVRAIRHVATPTVQYSYSPDFSAQAFNYYTTYKDTTGTYIPYSPYSTGLYGVPGNRENSSLTFSLGNNIEMKVRNAKDTVTGTKKIALIKSLNISSSYDLLADSMPWSDIRVTAQNDFFNRLSVKYTGNFNPYAMGKDSLGAIREVNKYMIDEYGRLWRKEQTQWDLSTSLSLGPIKKEKSALQAKTDALTTTRYPGYEDFSLPWAMTINYNLSFPKQYQYDEFSRVREVDSKIVQTASVSGNFTVTQKWKLTYSSGWDFTNEDFTITRFGIYRDLHCWELMFNWTPFGGMQRYEFKVNVKASVFQDLKYEKRENFGEVF